MKTFKFYGVDGNYYKLDDVVWKAIEDESDGYRSYLGSIEKVDDDLSNQIFFYEPLATVKVVEVNDNEFDGYRFIDIDDDHVWLEVGTSRYNEYYPYFTFSYSPKTSKSESDKADEWKKFIQ